MKTQDVRTYTEQRLRWLQNLPDNQRRAELAKLRRGVGHRPGELPELWGSFLLGMPEGFQGNNGPTAAEWAVYLALTLYAVHQQGNDQPMNRPHSTLGRAVRQLAERNTSAGQDWTEASVLRRFNALLVLPHRAAYVFFENVVKIFVLTNAALPADLGDGQFSFPDELQSVLNTAAVEVVNDRCAKLFLKLLVDVPFRVVELFLKVSKCYLAPVILFQIGYDA